MAYLRDKRQELTGYQEAAPFSPSIDLQCDFVMVYGVNEDMPKRVEAYRKQGYVVHLMTGIAWGQYQSYLNGEWDGRLHWDEAQTGRGEEKIIHNPTVPYMVPTVSFSDFLTQQLLRAVDAGVEAIHMEEPEFWDRGGYSEAFRREYEIYYKTPWQPPHTSLDVRYKCARLKAWLYGRTIGRISASLKEYAMVKYHRALRFYVPTHSLLNYTQWKIMSPEGALIDIPTVDGYIAQVWTGTSRSANVYQGIYKERTFETAFLEYGIMQELTKGTGRDMWFLHDPIEDLPSYTWENFRYNYLKTAVASLFHPAVSKYEICPWPHRVFDGVYPRYQPRIQEKIEESFATEESKPIPQSYATLLSGMVQLFGDMDQAAWSFENAVSKVGILMSDSCLYQRSFPDGIVQHGLGGRLDAVMSSNAGPLKNAEESRKVMEDILSDHDCFLDFVQSGAFPSFFGLCMPILKYGLPLRPVQLDNARRFPGYLDDYQTLILSYEFMKPESPDVNMALAAWVRSGGTLFYVGDSSDPYHRIDGWWSRAGYSDPCQHLFEMLGLSREPEEGTWPVGNGKLCFWRMAPARICLTKELADHWRSLLKKELPEWEYRNDITLLRGPYVICAVMDESVSDVPKKFQGLYADMLENRYDIIREKEVEPDGCAILFDFAKIEGENLRIIGCSARVYKMEVENGALSMELKAADRIKAFVRIRLPGKPMCVKAENENGDMVQISSEWDEDTQTALFSYESTDHLVRLWAELEEGRKE